LLALRQEKVRAAGEIVLLFNNSGEFILALLGKRLILKDNYHNRKTTKGLKIRLKVASMQTVALAIVVTGRLSVATVQ